MKTKKTEYMVSIPVSHYVDYLVEATGRKDAKMLAYRLHEMNAPLFFNQQLSLTVRRNPTWSRHIPIRKVLVPKQVKK